MSQLAGGGSGGPGRAAKCQGFDRDLILPILPISHDESYIELSNGWFWSCCWSHIKMLRASSGRMDVVYSQGRIVFGKT